MNNIIIYLNDDEKDFELETCINIIEQANKKEKQSEATTINFIRLANSWNLAKKHFSDSLFNKEV